MMQAAAMNQSAFAVASKPPKLAVGSSDMMHAQAIGLQTIDPLTDKRWDDFVSGHPKASIFHQSAWMRALANTYGYRPTVVTSAARGQQFSEAIPFCEVESWITGKRLVSLPFADHCEPLVDDLCTSSRFTEWLSTEGDSGRWKYIELRPLKATTGENPEFAPSGSFWFHTFDLTPSIDQIFRRFDKDSLQRRIRRAERENLSYEKGGSEQLLGDFYRLLLMTRRRHQWLPQPRAWFRNLAEYFGDNLQIRVSRKGDIPIAALLSLRFRNTVVYKYGCSDEKFHHLAGVPFLFWKLIEESKAEGAELLDLGRTDLGHDSLVRFKDQFGTERRQITYFRCPATLVRRSGILPRWSRLRRLCSIMPDAALSLAGRIAYRHIG